MTEGVSVSQSQNWPVALALGALVQYSMPKGNWKCNRSGFFVCADTVLFPLLFITCSPSAYDTISSRFAINMIMRWQHVYTARLFINIFLRLCLETLRIFHESFCGFAVQSKVAKIELIGNSAGTADSVNFLWSSNIYILGQYCSSKRSFRAQPNPLIQK